MKACDLGMTGEPFVGSIRGNYAGFPRSAKYGSPPTVGALGRQPFCPATMCQFGCPYSGIGDQVTLRGPVGALRGVTGSGRTARLRGSPLQLVLASDEDTRQGGSEINLQLDEPLAPLSQEDARRNRFDPLELSKAVASCRGTIRKSTASGIKRDA